VIISDIVSSRSQSVFTGAGLIAGIPGHSIEDIKIRNVYLEHVGGGTAAMASIVPVEQIKIYPDPNNFGPLPASGFYVRHAKNIEFSNVELAWSQPDARPAFWMQDVDGVDIFRLKLPRGNMGPTFVLREVSDFNLSTSHRLKDIYLDKVSEKHW